MNLRQNEKPSTILTLRNGGNIERSTETSGTLSLRCGKLLIRKKSGLIMRLIKMSIVSTLNAMPKNMPRNTRSGSGLGENLILTPRQRNGSGIAPGRWGCLTLLPKRSGVQSRKPTRGGAPTAASGANSLRITLSRFRRVGAQFGTISSRRVGHVTLQKTTRPPGRHCNLFLSRVL